MSSVVYQESPNNYTHKEQTINGNPIVSVQFEPNPPSGVPTRVGVLYLQFPDSEEGAMKAWVSVAGVPDEWVALGSGSKEPVDTSNLAKLDATNIFAEYQKIGSDVSFGYISTGRKTRLDPTDAASPDSVPFSAGDIIVREFNDGGVEHEIYVATEQGDANSWLKIYDSTNSVVDLDAQVKLLDGRLDALSDKLDLEITDLDNLGTTVGNLDAAMTDVEGDIALIGGKVDNLEPRVIANEEKILALETHHTGTTTKLEQHAGKITGVEEEVDILNTDMITVKGQVSSKLDKAGGTITGKMTLSTDANDEAILINKPSGKAGYIRGKRNNANNWYVGNGSSNNDSVSLHSDVNNKGLLITSGGLYAKIGSSEHEIYHAGNKPTAAEIGARPNTWTPSAADLDINAPATLTAKRYLVVNDAGTEVVMSTESTDDVESLAALGAGVVSGDACISTKCLGGETTILSGTSNSISTSKSNFIFGTPSGTVTYTLGDIITWDSTDLGNNKVREGCMITVANCGSGTMRLAADGTTRFQTRGGTRNNIDIEGSYTFMLMPQIWADGTKVYNVIGVVSSAG